MRLNRFGIELANHHPVLVMHLVQVDDGRQGRRIDLKIREYLRLYTQSKVNITEIYYYLHDRSR